MADGAAMAASEFWSLFHLLAGTHTFDAKEESGEAGKKGTDKHTICTYVLSYFKLPRYGASSYCNYVYACEVILLWTVCTVCVY